MDKINKYIKLSFLIIGVVSIGAMFGVIGISEEFIILYYGKEFIECVYVMKTLAPIIIIVCLGNVIVNQFILPRKKDKLYVTSFIVSMIMNVIFDIILIPIIGIKGAIIGTLIAESTSVIIQFISARKELPIFKIFVSIFPFFICGIMMLIIINLVDYLNFNSMITILLIKVAVGLITYCLLCLLYFLVLGRKDLEILKNIVFKKKSAKVCNKNGR